MAYTLTNFQDEVDRITKISRSSPEVVSAADRNQFIQDAVMQYSKYKPRRVISDITGTASFLIALPSDWVADFSWLLEQIEYPYVSTNQERDLIDDNDWEWYWDTSNTLKIRLLSDTPATTEKVRLTYAVPHTLSSSTNTMSDSAFKPVCNLAASFDFDAAAAYYAKTFDATTGSDAVNYQTKSAEYLTLSLQKKIDFEEAMGIGKFQQPVKAASVTGEIDLALITGSDYLSPHHRKPYR